MLGTKLISFILQAGIVILAVLIYGFFDPFNLLRSKRLTMKDTPTVVNSIQGIGKLITAEYYGEVIKGTGEALEHSIDSLKNDDFKSLKKILEDVNDSLVDLKFSNENAGKPIRNQRQLYKKFSKEYPQIIHNPDYNVLIKWVDKNYKLNEKKFLFALYENKDDNFDQFAIGGRTIKFDDVITSYLNEKYAQNRGEKKRIANNSLVVLGRGWVKAGFDFSNFDDDHVNYLPDRNLVRLVNHQPEIISATINPWFIPERKIKGFEYLYVGKKIDKNADNENAVKIIQDLKASCLNDLIKDAREAGIMESAIEQAEISLQELFSLLLGKRVTVKIYASPIDAVLEDILRDSVISRYDIASADSLVNRYYQEEPENIFNFLKTIYEKAEAWKFDWKPFDDRSVNWETLSYYYKVADDGFCTTAELEAIRQYVADTTRSLKDYLYYSLKNPTTMDVLGRQSFDLKNIPAKEYSDVRASRITNQQTLFTAVSNLRRELTAAELKKCDSTIGNFLARNNVNDAYKFAEKTETYMDETEPWEGARTSWQLLAIYKEIQNQFSSEKINQLVSQFPSTPTYNEYFYYLFYSGELKNNLEVSTNLLKLLKQNTLPADDKTRQEFERIRKTVSDIHNKNKLRLSESSSRTLKQKAEQASSE